jgi:hypothetical protein
MRNFILIAAAGAFAAAAPAVAGPGKGHGNGHAKGHGASHGPVHHGSSHGAMAARGCPPGLAKKGNGCLPPGQAKKLFSVGQRVPTGYGYYTPYSSIPRQYRDRIPYGDDYRYIYRDNTAYVVNERTNLVTQVIDLLMR